MVLCFWVFFCLEHMVSLFSEEQKCSEIFFKYSKLERCQFGLTLAGLPRNFIFNQEILRFWKKVKLFREFWQLGLSAQTPNHGLAGWQDGWRDRRQWLFTSWKSGVKLLRQVRQELENVPKLEVSVDTSICNEMQSHFNVGFLQTTWIVILKRSRRSQ